MRHLHEIPCITYFTSGKNSCIITSLSSIVMFGGMLGEIC